MQQEKKISDEDRLILLKKIIFENFDPIGINIDTKKSTYNVDDHLLELLDYCKQILDIILENKLLKYNDVPDLLTADLFNNNRGIVFAIKHHKLKKIKICHTSKINNILSYIKFNILLYKVGLKNCFSCFKSNDLTEFYFCQLENVTGNKIHLINREKYWKNIYFPGESLTNEDVEEKMEKIYNTRMAFFYEILESFSIDFFEKRCDIYKFMNVKNGRIYICGFDKKMDGNKLINIILGKNNNKIKNDMEMYGANAFKLIKIETFKTKTPIDLMLRIDFNKINNN